MKLEDLKRYAEFCGRGVRELKQGFFCSYGQVQALDTEHKRCRMELASEISALKDEKKLHKQREAELLATIEDLEKQLNSMNSYFRRG